MKWNLITKSKEKQPAGEDYTKWKNQIAEECFLQCVYCAIHETSWGGIDHYHIDHYRPKSIEEFASLINDICNLFYACPVCNRFKSNDWPGECLEDFSNAAYPDPSKVDYSTLIDIDEKDFTLKGLVAASKYIIQRLYLNRPQLIYERREAYLHAKQVSLMSEIVELANKADDKDIYRSVLDASQRIAHLQNERKKVRPYKLAEIRR